jgi:hypothetical protein
VTDFLKRKFTEKWTGSGRPASLSRGNIVHLTSPPQLRATTDYPFAGKCRQGDTQWPVTLDWLNVSTENIKMRWVLPRHSQCPH